MYRFKLVFFFVLWMSGSDVIEENRTLQINSSSDGPEIQGYSK